LENSFSAFQTACRIGLELNTADLPPLPRKRGLSSDDDGFSMKIKRVRHHR
jgi:hypothetical protein